MRYSNCRQTDIERVVRKFGPLMALVFVILAGSGEACADTSAATGRLNGDAHLVAGVNDQYPLPEQWQAYSADGLRQADKEREEVREVEEIKVIANPEGVSALEFEKMRHERMREAMYAELRLRERIAYEMAWWQADPDLKNPESPIKWGYSPQAEIRMHRDNDFVHALSANHVKPASVLRIAF